MTLALQPLNYTQRICVSCVMDTSDTAITFDEHGVCDHCRTFHAVTKPAWRTGEDGREDLEAMVRKIKTAGEGKDYDCIIGLSGGIDSSYLTYLAKKVLGLRPLVFHVDAGWNSQEAVNNIERIVDVLDLDLFTQVIDWEEMRDLQLAFFKSGVPHLDAPQDHSFFATMYQYAEKYGVSNILTGANISTECVRNPLEWIYYADATQLRDIHKRFGERPLVKYPVSPIIRHKVYLPYVKGIRVVRPLDLMPYVKADAMKLLMDELGWQPYPQKHFESRFTKFFEGYWLPERFGYDVRKVQFSSLILTGQMTRDEALDRLRQKSYDVQAIAHDKAFVANKLAITVSDLDGYMALPKKTYRDYANQQRLFKVGAWGMKLLGLEIGGKR